MTYRTLFRTVEAIPDDGAVLRLEYYLLTDHAHFDGGSLEVYGVEILLYRPDRRKPEIARVRGITPLGSRILRILQCLCDNTVTPGGLNEAMETVLETV